MVRAPDATEFSAGTGDRVRDPAASKHGIIVFAMADTALKGDLLPRLSEHYRAVEAPDMAHVAEVLRRVRPDMVIVDTTQPTETRAFVETTKRDATLRSIPILVICDEAHADAFRAEPAPDDIVFRSAGAAVVCARVRADVELGRLRATTRAQQELVARTRQEIMRRLLAAEEDERARLARELHDGIGQTLTACRLLLPQLRARDTAGAAAAIGALEQLTSDIARDLHRVAVTLRPTALDDLGLNAALAGYLEEWSASTGIAATAHFGNVASPSSIVIATTIFRIVQEVLSNVAKHTQAQNVALVAEQAGDVFSIIVEDDGAGFDVEAELAAKPHAWGIAAIRERATLLGGDLKIESTPGQGTTVYLRVPLGAGAGQT